MCGIASAMARNSASTGRSAPVPDTMHVKPRTVPSRSRSGANASSSHAGASSPPPSGHAGRPTRNDSPASVRATYGPSVSRASGQSARLPPNMAG